MHSSSNGQLPAGQAGLLQELQLSRSGTPQVSGILSQTYVNALNVDGPEQKPTSVSENPPCLTKSEEIELVRYTNVNASCTSI